MERIQKLFLEVKKDFPEIISKLKPSDMRSFMSSCPLSKNIYYNLEQVKNLGFSEMALKGVLAHELSHKIDYKEQGFIFRIFFKFNYVDKNKKFKRNVERRVDRITIRRGYGREYLQSLKESRKKFEKKVFDERVKPFHLSEKEVLSEINKRGSVLDREQKSKNRWAIF